MFSIFRKKPKAEPPKREIPKDVPPIKVSITTEHNHIPDKPPSDDPYEIWKSKSYPSARGLYPPEILLLQYCTYGSYPNPRNGYPGLWEYKYDLKDVNAVLSSLEERGFIERGPPAEGLKGLKVDELRELLKAHDLPTAGKKDELIARVSESIPKDVLKDKGIAGKYRLTSLGQSELNENSYVSYMHDNSESSTYNVWTVNRYLHDHPDKPWVEHVTESYVDQRKEELRRLDEPEPPFEERMASIKKYDPERYEEMLAEYIARQPWEEDFRRFRRAYLQHEIDGDEEAYLKALEDLWHGSECHLGDKHHYYLVDQYVKMGMHDKAYEELLTFKEPSDRLEKYKRRLAPKKV